MGAKKSFANKSFTWKKSVKPKCKMFERNVQRILKHEFYQRHGRKKFDVSAPDFCIFFSFFLRSRIVCCASFSFSGFNLAQRRITRPLGRLPRNVFPHAERRDRKSVV